MPCLITALTRSAIRETTRKENKQQMSKNKNFKAKTQNQNLKAPSKKVKMQSNKTLTTQTHKLTFS